MGSNTITSQDDPLASLLRWWHDAGVDTIIAEEPRRWLADATETIALLKSKPVAALPVVPEPPQVPEFATLGTLTQWLMNDSALSMFGSASRRVAPSGDLSSGLMIVVDSPDLADLEAGALLSGDVGTLFDAMIAALGHNRQSIYLASVSPGRPATGQIDDLSFQMLTPILKRHVTLAGPRQLWLLGSAASRAILGMSDVAAHGKLHHVNLNDATLDVVVTAHPRYLTTKDRKARAWTEMKRLMAKDNL